MPLDNFLLFAARSSSRQRVSVLLLVTQNVHILFILLKYPI